jgi:hypothetical protein
VVGVVCEEILAFGVPLRLARAVEPAGMAAAVVAIMGAASRRHREDGELLTENSLS